MKPTHKFVEHVAHAIREHLSLFPDATINGEQVYKFSMNVWFDIENKDVKNMSVNDVKFKSMHKALKKKLTSENTNQKQ